MTVANKLTVGRILLIPVFVVFAVYYGKSVSRGHPEEWLRLAAIAAFVVAAVTDALDGWVARRFKQKSRLGVILDPLADKGLLLSAIITLSVSNWTYELPIWFAVTVIARDIAILAGCAVLKVLVGHLEVRPSWLGKTATALQMVALSWVMLQLPHYMYSVWAAGLVTAASGVGYLLDGVRQLGEHSHPTNPS